MSKNQCKLGVMSTAGGRSMIYGATEVAKIYIKCVLENQTKIVQVSLNNFNTENFVNIFSKHSFRFKLSLT